MAWRRRVMCDCSRSHGQPVGERNLAMTRSKSSMERFFFMGQEEGGSENDKIVPMYQLDAGELFPADFIRTKFCNAAGKLHSVQVANTDDISSIKIAFAAGDARREQALSIFAQGLFSAFINIQRA